MSDVRMVVKKQQQQQTESLNLSGLNVIEALAPASNLRSESLRAVSEQRMRK